MPDSPDTRRSVYLLLTAVAAAAAAARVFGAEIVYEPSRYTATEAGGYSKVPPDPKRYWPRERPEPMPMFSSNDKSRWATIRALVEDKTYIIGTRVTPHRTDPRQKYEDIGITERGKGYDTLDKVMHPETKHFYSSKPPLMPTVLAGEYWLLKKVFGWNIDRDRWLVVPFIVFTVNVIPFVVYLILIARLIDGMGKTDFGKLVAFTTAAVGTYLITFAGTLNNHSPAAYCVLFAVYPLVRAIQQERDMTPAGYGCCGFFSALAATFDLPALSLVAALGIPLLVSRPRQTLAYFLPFAVLPIAALLACNYAAFGTFEPVYEKFGGPWYNYEGSHWAKAGTPDAKGIDFNQEPTSVYAFHLLFGHHGWFSLTPVFLLALAGLIGLGIRSAADVRKMFGKVNGTGWTMPVFAAMTLVVSATVFGFYLTRTQSYNYGGFTSGPRWLFWLIPLWVIAIVPAADRLASSRGGRLLCAILLGFAVLSVFYPAANPWRHPWILNLMEYTGVKRY